MKTILYGVGKSVFYDFEDPTKIIALGDLQNLTVNMSAETEEIRGGDSPYPITEFPRTNTITVTAQNALFDVSYLDIVQGVREKEMDDYEMTEFLDIHVPEDGIVNLKIAPVAKSLNITGMIDDDIATTLDPTDPRASLPKFKVTDKKITFPETHRNMDITGVYKVLMPGKARSRAGVRGKFPKPFKFVHRIPVYNESNQIIAQMELTIFKCRSDNNFEFNFQPQTAFAPQMTLRALDAKRSDCKLWEVVTVEVDPEDADFCTED